VSIARGQHLIGTMLGSYILERLLGYGGSSAVYLAQDYQSEQKVAVKVFLPRDNLSPRIQRDFYRRFLHEAKAVSKLDHPNILPIYSYGEEEGLPYIVMPYMEGGTLLDYMSRRGTLSLHEAQWYLEQLTAAIDYAHKHGCVHCDIKPANMLLDSAGRVMLSDFGIAHLMSNSEQSASVATKTSDAVMGTPDYVSPEQALGQHIDGCSDIYSLGVTLFFLLAKRLPFKADTPIAVALLHIHEPPPSLSLLRADVSPALDRVVQKALAKDSARRFQTAGEFYAAFVSALANGHQQSSLASLKEVSSFDDDLSDDFLDSVSNLPTSQPIVRLLPLQPKQPLRWRLAILFVASLIILSVAATTLVLIASHSPQKTKPAPALHPTPSPPKDKLADTKNWPSSRTFFFDSRSTYHVLNTSPNGVALAPYFGNEYHDFHLTVVTSEIRHASRDSGYYGVIFRASTDQQHYYLLEIAPDENSYSFLRYDGSEAGTNLFNGHLPIPVNSNTPNSLTVDAYDNTFSFSVNGTSILQAVSDPSKPPLPMGQIGLCVEDQGTEVAFSQLYIDSQP
jgi:serine/threonine protein kinase